MSAAPQDLARLQAAGAPLRVRLMRGDAVELEPVRWAWKGYLPFGMLTIIGGSPGTGKTTIAAALAAVITRRGQWPDGTRCTEAGDVIFWSGEDAHAVLAARLKASGADMTRVHFVDGISGGEGEPFDPGRDMPLLEATLEKLAAPRLLILDPIVSAVTGDSHKGAEVRRSLQPVVELAQRLGCAVLGVTHFSKGTAGRDPVERVTGSIAFAALARLVLVAAKARPEPGEEGEPRRVLLRAKSNIGPDDGGFAYALERQEVAPEVEGQRVRWLESLEGSARDILTEAESDPNADDAGEDAAGFLRGLLADGPMAAKAVFSEASGAGYSKDQMNRAGRRLNVAKEKRGMAGGWVWALPAPEGGGKGPEDREDCSSRGVPPSATFAPSSAADDLEVM